MTKYQKRVETEAMALCRAVARWHLRRLEAEKRSILKVVYAVVSHDAVERLRVIDAHKDHDTYQDGYESLAMSIRCRLARAGYKQPKKARVDP